MKQTPKYKFNLIEVSDQISPAPLNANAERVEAVLTEQAEARTEDNRVISTALGAKVMMAAGAYDGNDELSRTIETPGFTPTIVLMRTSEFKQYQDNKGMGNYWHQDVFSIQINSDTKYVSGWLVWRGGNISTVVYEEGFTGRHESKATTIEFTPELGKLTWKLADSGAAELQSGFAALVNNRGGETYEWIAFGVADVELGSREGVVVNDE